MIILKTVLGYHKKIGKCDTGRKNVKIQEEFLFFTLMVSFLKETKNTIWTVNGQPMCVDSSSRVNFKRMNFLK